MKYYIGIDLGGTNIAGGLVDENGKILKKISVPTEVERGENAIIDNIADLCGKICDESNISFSSPALFIILYSKYYKNTSIYLQKKSEQANMTYSDFFS